MPRCAACRESFERRRPLQAACSPACALEVARRKRERAQAKETAAARKAHKARVEKLKTRGEWMAEAQAAVNRYVKLRDLRAGYGCVSCGAPYRLVRGGAFDAGHWRSRGSAPHLRFDTRQIALQCRRCNDFGAGMPVEFEAELIRRRGAEVVAAIKADQVPRKYTVDYLRRLRDIFRRRAARIERKLRGFVPGHNLHQKVKYG